MTIASTIFDIMPEWFYGAGVGIAAVNFEIVQATTEVAFIVMVASGFGMMLREFAPT